MKIERRIRFGRYEWRCTSDGRWYVKLAAHIHKFHREECICSKKCKDKRQALLRRVDPLANPKR